MRILGIDPGLGATGLGVIEGDRDTVRHVYHTAVRPSSSLPLPERLEVIRSAVRDAARDWHADAAAVESGYVGPNPRSALALGQARAAALLGVADAGIPVFEYAPAIVKQTIAGYGRGDKGQVARMVRLQLGLEEEPRPADAADALAVAITHWAHWRLDAARPSDARSGR
ncbi:Crossover junction endodeoxyribonuclease RuvC [bacterium HR29]|mgnify:CR=1 FL=1|jgi:crossover junction endodeoxyribonuclease RuvC|nr:Crossover junction endodeoxyribonuclease RuvC [bacterium HR29]